MDYHAIIRALAEINGSHADDAIRSMVRPLMESPIVAVFFR